MIWIWFLIVAAVLALAFKGKPKQSARWQAPARRGSTGRKNKR